jgi:hypothetical protein
MNSTPSSNNRLVTILVATIIALFILLAISTQSVSVSHVQKKTIAWRLDPIPQRHFRTGSSEQINPVWSNYHISVTAQGTQGDTYLIDSFGQIRWYVSTPYTQTDAS